VFDSDLERSADQYLGSADLDPDLFYAYKISRTCATGEPFCLPLTPPDPCSRFTLQSSTLLGVAFRLYLEPRTNIGPAYPEILYDRIIKFSTHP
jgi:hypothetical protein